MGFVEDFVFNPDVPDVTLEHMNEINSVLDAPFHFYSGYMQLAQFKKTEIAKSEVIKKLA